MPCLHPTYHPRSGLAVGCALPGRRSLAVRRTQLSCDRCRQVDWKDTAEVCPLGQGELRRDEESDGLNWGTVLDRGVQNRPPLVEMLRFVRVYGETAAGGSRWVARVKQCAELQVCR